MHARVIFHGHVSSAELSELLRSAYVAAFPSRWETFGIVALEAMAAGVPVIVSAGTGLEAVVGDNYELVVGPPCDAEQLKKALGDILSDVELRNRLANTVSGRAQKVLEQGQVAIRELLENIKAKKLYPRRSLPIAQVTDLFRAVWISSEKSQSHLRQLLTEREAELQLLTAEVQRLDEIVHSQSSMIHSQNSMLLARDSMIHSQNSMILARDSMILQRDEGILHRDQIIADLQGELAAIRAATTGVAQSKESRSSKK
jgi:hypothetical protein